MFCSILLKCFD